MTSRKGTTEDLTLYARWRIELDVPGAALMTKREAANYLRIAPATLDAMQRRAELPSTVKIAGREHFRRVDLERLIGIENGAAEGSAGDRNSFDEYFGL